MSEDAQQVRSAALLEAAAYAEFYADERLRLCYDTVLHDPIFSAKHGAPITRADIAKSRDLQVDGTINSAAFHAASDIAEHLRKLATPSPKEPIYVLDPARFSTPFFRKLGMVCRTMRDIIGELGHAKRPGNPTIRRK